MTEGCCAEAAVVVCGQILLPRVEVVRNALDEGDAAIAGHGRWLRTQEQT